MAPAARWRLRKPHADIERHCEALRVAGDLDPLLARLLCLRGVEREGLSELLNPTIKSLFPDPSLLLDLDKACERLLRALREGETIGIITDYDTDGACSAALMIQAWRAWGGEYVYTVPDRFKEGYGPNDQAFERLRRQGAQGLVLTLDCGSNAERVLRSKQQQGWEVIVIDHHLLGDARREAEQAEAVFAMVNPQRAGNAVDLRSLSACGVVLVLLASLRRKLEAERKTDATTDAALSFPLKSWLDVVALATVCDVVPFSPLNRAFARAGLAHWNAQRHTGLMALAEQAGKAPPFSIRDLAFVFGPRLNAAGRMGEAELAVELLLCVDDQSVRRAQKIAQSLEALNTRRRQQQEACCRQARRCLSERTNFEGEDEGEKGRERGASFLYDRSWSIGVLGPSASRLAERFSVPVFLAAPSPVAEQAHLLRGSARLPPFGWQDCSLANIAAEAQQKGLLQAAGGHARACGFSLREEDAEAFQQFLDEKSREHAQRSSVNVAGATQEDRSKDRSKDHLEDYRTVDMELSPAAVERNLAENLTRLAPFGEGHREPLFAFRDVFVEDCRALGKEGKHMACTFSAEGGVARARAIAFDAVQRGLADALRSAAESRTKRWAIGKVHHDPYAHGAQIILEDLVCLVEEGV